MSDPATPLLIAAIVAGLALAVALFALAQRRRVSRTHRLARPARIVLTVAVVCALVLVALDGSRAQLHAAHAWLRSASDPDRAVHPQAPERRDGAAAQHPVASAAAGNDLIALAIEDLGCARAPDQVARAICSDPALLAIHGRLESVYAALEHAPQAFAPREDDSVRSTRRFRDVEPARDAWAVYRNITVRTVCRTGGSYSTDCIRAVYEERISDLAPRWMSTLAAQSY
jgi:hypothetical protein